MSTNAIEQAKKPTLTSPLGLLLAFVLVGLVVGLRTLAIVTLPHILDPGPATSYQEVSDGLPVPRLLNWGLAHIEMLFGLRDAGIGSILLAGVVLFLPLWLLCVRTLNPTFFLISDEQRASGLNAALDGYGLMKALRLLFLMTLPMIAVWVFSGGFDHPATELRDGPFPIAIQPYDLGLLARLVVLGIVMWLTFTPGGLAGDFNTIEIYTPRRAPALLLTGVGFGVLVWLACRLCLPPDLQNALYRYETLGTFNIRSWFEIAFHYLLSLSGVWLAAGLWFYALARPGLSAAARGLCGTLGLAFALGGWIIGRPLAPAALNARFDLTPQVVGAIYPYTPNRPSSGLADGIPVGRELARQAGLKPYTPRLSESRSVLIFNRQFVSNMRQPAYSEDGLPGDPASAHLVTDFLARRGYQTALSWVAIKHLYNLGTMNFDATTAMQALLLDMRRCPHLSRDSFALQTMLFTCAATPTNLAVLDTWADERIYAFPDRQSRRLIGDLYRRFGRPDKALLWYRKAEMPRSFLARVQGEQPLFHAGQVSGVLRLDGKPLAGVQVGVVPSLMNGLPKIMEETVRNGIAELQSPDDPRLFPLFPAYYQRPWKFRWVAAGTLTDAQGRYTLDGLTEGTYTVICTLPARLHLNPPEDNLLQIKNPPIPATVNYTAPRHDAGATDLFWGPQPARTAFTPARTLAP